MADRLSTLPDSILSLILSKLPITDAMKCSVLSKSWRFHFTEMPELDLSPYLITPTHRMPFSPDPFLLATVENIISNILRLHSSDLKSFSLSTAITPPRNRNYIAEQWKFTGQNLSEWMRCVARKNVEHLFLEYSYDRQTPPPALFSCNRLTVLTLYNCLLTAIPPEFTGFKHLTMCTFRNILITEEVLAHFILQCPLLQNIKLELLEGVQRPAISALNVTDLTVQYCRTMWQPVPPVQGLTVNCPNLKFLVTVNVRDLTVNGMTFHELSPAITVLKMDLGSNFIELSLSSHYTSFAYNLTVNRFLELVGNLRSLKVLDIFLEWNLVQYDLNRSIVVPLFNLLSRLPNLESLRLSGDLILEESEGDPVPPYPILGNLQFVEIQLYKYDEMELRLLCCLLEIAPALKELKLKPAAFFSSTAREDGERRLELPFERYNSFLGKWEALKKAREEGKITENIREFSFYFKQK